MDTRHIKSLLVMALFFGMNAHTFAQETEQKEEEEINYVWIDTMVTIDSVEVRLVSDQVTRITCCMKSPKYSRVSAKAAKWIRKTYDADYDGMPFKTLQNLQLANTVVDAAKEKAGNDTGLKMVNYEYKCD